MNPTVRSSLASIPRQLPTRTCRRISNRRLKASTRSFHQTRSQQVSDSNKPESEATISGNVKTPEDGIREAHSKQAIASNPPRTKNLSHYGSAARRAGRHRVARTFHTPTWFIEENVKIAEASRGPAVNLLKYSVKKEQYVEPWEDPEPSMEEILSETDQAPENSSPKPVDEPKEPTTTLQPKQDDTEQAQSQPASPYFLDSSQWEELVATASGLMRLAPESSADDVASRRNHLIIHYAGDSGHYLLEEVTSHLAKSLEADLVSLDALDIADLLCEPRNRSVTDDKADERRLFSFDVYPSEDSRANEAQGEDDQPQEYGVYDGEAGGASRIMMPTIHLDVRASPFDLGQSNRPRGRRPSQAAALPRLSNPDMASFFTSGNTVAEKAPEPIAPRSLPLIQALLSAPSLARSSTSNGDEQVNTSPSAAVQGAEKPLVVAVKDLKLIQQTPFGVKILNVLYNEVQGRRRKGQQVMIIGTSTSPKDTNHNTDTLKTLQDPSPSNISRTIVITPTLPSEEARQVLKLDGCKRQRTINLRNLWQMLCVKMPELYSHSQARKEWQAEIENPSPWFCYGMNQVGAESEVWTFDFVHRLATLMIGAHGVDPDSIRAHFTQACRQLSNSEVARARLAYSHKQKNRRTKNGPEGENPETHRLDKIRKKANKYEKKLMSGVIEPHKITTSFDHVHVPADTIEALQTLTTLSLVRPEAFTYGILASDKISGLLLYGPPGTGKTLLAKAVAKESGATVLEVTGAELNDMYVGEGEKNVKALFTLAKKISPCVVFIDEADAVFSARDSGHRRVSHRELLNQFLREWDGMNNDAGAAFIMVATNRPFDLDDAILRRLPRRLLVDLPTEKDRLEILRIHLRDEKVAEDVSLDDLAVQTPFYSGSDLKNLCVAAALSCVREENLRAKQHTGDEAFEYVQPRILQLEHFKKGLEDITSSISSDMSSLKQLKKFDEQFGDKRGQRKKTARWGFNTTAEADKVLDTVKIRDQS